MTWCGGLQFQRGW